MMYVSMWVSSEDWTRAKKTRRFVRSGAWLNQNPSCARQATFAALTRRPRSFVVGCKTCIWPPR